MNYILHQELDLTLESIAILTRLQGDSYLTLIQRLQSDLKGSPDEEPYTRYLENYIRLCEAVKAAVDLSGPEMNLLFRRRDGLQPLAHALWWYGIISEQEGTDTPDLTARAVPEQREIIASMVELFNDLISPAELIDHPQGIPGWLEENVNLAEDRYDLLRLYAGFAHYLRYLEPYIVTVSRVIAEQISSWQQEVHRQAKLLADRLSHDGLSLGDWLSIREDPGELYHIYPTLDFSVTVFSGHRGDSRLYCCIFVDELLQSRNLSLFDSQISEISRAIAETTKLNILTMLKKGECYAGQLATALRLTSPTISYHMNSLVQLHLVNLEKRGNRVFYDLNRTTVASYLQALGKMLISE
ncbi:MAG: metalloregulator ArsR/SmtB family transcription factor [Symbiobacteriaceae bacterium]|nr:metalloregulator ArsR/SmtB family transcription factor [Symbiobacteriaceae bacterium]